MALAGNVPGCQDLDGRRQSGIIDVQVEGAVGDGDRPLDGALQKGGHLPDEVEVEAVNPEVGRITSYNVCYTKLLRSDRA